MSAIERLNLQSRSRPKIPEGQKPCQTCQTPVKVWFSEPVYCSDCTALSITRLQQADQ